jgi:hypothetical protein
MPKKSGLLHNRIAAAARKYNQAAGLSFNLDFGSKFQIPSDEAVQGQRIYAGQGMAISFSNRSGQTKILVIITYLPKDPLQLGKTPELNV